jgi:hypothetical protein
MRTIQTESRASAGSCHSQTAVHARLRARSKARPRAPLALMLSGLIAIGAIVADTAYAGGTEECKALHARAEVEAGHKAGDTATERGIKSAAGRKKFEAKYFQESSNVVDLLHRGVQLSLCGY